jgi:hypothetical protein
VIEKDPRMLRNLHLLVWKAAGKDAVLKANMQQLQFQSSIQRSEKLRAFITMC